MSGSDGAGRREVPALWRGGGSLRHQAAHASQKMSARRPAEVVFPQTSKLRCASPRSSPSWRRPLRALSTCRVERR
eukprot:3152343-Alexandrium_andersonii.AAC.1